MNEKESLIAIVSELDRAQRKFPTFPIDPVHAAAVVAEESGELVRAVLQYTYECGSLDAVKKEAIHTGAMALRFLLMMDQMESRPSKQAERVSDIVQHSQGCQPGKRSE
jgi:NTP pyrophosphatase (non-canonical NTP hydrolase)